MSHGTVTVWSHHIMVMVIRLCEAKKVIESSGTNNSIQHGESMLAL